MPYAVGRLLNIITFESGITLACGRNLPVPFWHFSCMYKFTANTFMCIDVPLFRVFLNLRSFNCKQVGAGIPDAMLTTKEALAMLGAWAEIVWTLGLKTPTLDQENVCLATGEVMYTP